MKKNFPPREQLKETLFEHEISKIAKNAGYSGIGILIAYLIGYFSSIITTRVIGTDNFGIFLLASSIFGLSHLIATLGLNQGVLRYVSLYFGKNDPARVKGSILFCARVTLMTSLIVGTALFWLAPLLSKEVFHKPGLTVGLRILAVGLPFFTVASIYLTSLQGLQLIKLKTSIDMIAQPLSRLIFMLVLFVSGFKLLGVLWASVLSNIIVFALAFYYLKKSGNVFLNHKISAIFEKRRIVTFSSPLFFEGVFFTLTANIDILMLGYFVPSTDIGIYGIALKLGVMVIIPLTAFNMIFAPIISNLYSRNEKETLEKLFKTVTKWILTISFAIFLILALFAKPILSVFGQDFVAGATVLLILLFSKLVDAATGSVGYILKMSGRPKINMINSAILCVTIIVMNLLLIPSYGITGAAMGTACSVIFLNVIRILELYYFERIHPYQKNFIKPLISGILAASIVYGLGKLFPYEQSVFISMGFTIIFLIAYTVFLLLFTLDDDDKHVLNLIGKKMKLVP